MAHAVSGSVPVASATITGRVTAAKSMIDPGGASYDLGRCCALVAAYRFLDVDYDQDCILYDVRLGGPTLGVTLRF